MPCLFMYPEMVFNPENLVMLLPENVCFTTFVCPFKILSVFFILEVVLVLFLFLFQQLENKHSTPLLQFIILDF